MQAQPDCCTGTQIYAKSAATMQLITRASPQAAQHDLRSPHLAIAMYCAHPLSHRRQMRMAAASWTLTSSVKSWVRTSGAT